MAIPLLPPEYHVREAVTSRRQGQLILDLIEAPATFAGYRPGQYILGARLIADGRGGKRVPFTFSTAGFQRTQTGARILSVSDANVASGWFVYDHPDRIQFSHPPRWLNGDELTPVIRVLTRLAAEMLPRANPGATCRRPHLFFHGTPPGIRAIDPDGRTGRELLLEHDKVVYATLRRAGTSGAWTLTKRVVLDGAPSGALTPRTKGVPYETLFEALTLWQTLRWLARRPRKGARSGHWIRAGRACDQVVRK